MCCDQISHHALQKHNYSSFAVRIYCESLRFVNILAKQIREFEMFFLGLGPLISWNNWSGNIFHYFLAFQPLSELVDHDKQTQMEVFWRSCVSDSRTFPLFCLHPPAQRTESKWNTDHVVKVVTFRFNLRVLTSTPDEKWRNRSPVIVLLCFYGVRYV